MTDRLVVDLSADGAVRVASVLDGELPSFGEAAALKWPLGGDALEDLRWYLEDYLIVPYGVYEDRGARIARELDGWGRKMFGALFGTGQARDAYLRMRARGDVEVVFRSDTPSLLGLPWELMADPARDSPIALDTAGVSRALPTVPDAAETVAVTGGRLRVLMVISRPSGIGDVGYRMVARPLMDRLEAVRGQVDLVVLRPPTLDSLRAELKRAADAGTPYQVVHFDGHGVMPGRSAGGSPLMFSGVGGEGVLVFEKPGGGPDHVSASVIAHVLKDAKVPVVVLNACQSGVVGKELEAAVAIRLLREGVASVVAMAYSMYAVAAAEFMAAFYERLFAGGTVSSAVTAGRQQLFGHPGRPSPKGELPLADWVVPVHYVRREVSFPQAIMPRPAELPSLADALAELTAQNQQGGAGDLDAVDGVFVGRDALFYELEVAARLQKIVILVGPGGTGKTELVRAFGRWWRDTGGIEQPEWAFWHSFEPGVATFGLDGVINEIGVALYSTPFTQLDIDQRRAVVRKALTDHRMLLIWDNFESVWSMPDPGRATPPLNEAGCAQLRDFLASLRGGKSAVLITSRTPENWLGPVRRIEVGGLTQSEANQYADILLAPYPATRKGRTVPAFADLMTWLDGHPLSMRLILPRMDMATPKALLEALQGTAQLPGDDADQGRTGSLAASMAYSYAHLSEQTRRLLPAVSLCQGVADATVLRLFSKEAGVPERFAGATRDHWVAALDDAARVGLLTRLAGAFFHGYPVYRIHPALPGYLAAAWRAENPGAHDAVLSAAMRALLTAHAGLGAWLDRQMESIAAGIALTVAGLERHSLGSLLGYALSHQHWAEARAIALSLQHYWKARGLDTEAVAWTDRVIAATETSAGAPPLLDSPAGALWLLFATAQADRDLKRGQLDRAEARYLKILGMLQATDSSPDRQRRAWAHYHRLGMLAEEQWRLDEAEGWHRQSLATGEEIGDRPGMASTYGHLGRVALQRGRLGEAQDWYQRALLIQEEVGDRPGMAGTYHQLGRVAQENGQLSGAEDWYRRALVIAKEVGDRPAMANAYHQLGVMALLRAGLDEAEEWHRRVAVDRRGSRRPPGDSACVSPAGHGCGRPGPAGRGGAVVPEVGGHQAGDREPPRTPLNKACRQAACVCSAGRLAVTGSGPSPGGRDERRLVACWEPSVRGHGAGAARAGAAEPVRPGSRRRRSGSAPALTRVRRFSPAHRLCSQASFLAVPM